MRSASDSYSHIDFPRLKNTGTDLLGRDNVRCFIDPGSEGGQMTPPLEVA